VAGRLSWRPVASLSIGASAARGIFLSDEVRRARTDAPSGSGDQRAFGIDAEASWGRWLVRGEFVAAAWRLPALDAPQITDPLKVRSGYLEAKIRLGPRLYVAARADRMAFSSIAAPGGMDQWEADVSRLECGVGYTVRRGLLVKASVLGNWRAGGRVRQSTLGAAQVLFWF
jgi:hypothetical protein